MTAKTLVPATIAAIAVAIFRDMTGAIAWMNGRGAFVLKFGTTVD